ncbi:unnamed protein product [Rotaria sp. Silwood1]|nr:unnamed protein product [Rotaria sp. Silwood1]
MIIHEIFTLASQLVEQIPIQYIFSDIYKRSSGLFKLLKPVTNYINELSTQIEVDPLAAKQAIKILLKFSILKASLKDILSLLSKLIFDTTEIYDVRELCIELNTYLIGNAVESEEDQKTSTGTNKTGWFLAAVKKPLTTTDHLSSTAAINLCMDQWLMFLFRCIHFYDHVRFVCATTDYIQELLNIYHNNQYTTTRLLVLKILRDLVTQLPEDMNGTTGHIIEKLLTEILFNIGDNSNTQRTMNTNNEIVTEFIYIYRTLMSQYSPWQRMATELVINAVKSSLSFELKSLESVERTQMNFFLASLSILGGYIRPYCLGSVVQIYDNDKSNNPWELGVIIEIDASALESDTHDALPYFVQSATTNKTEWIMANKLYIVTDVLPSNLMLLSTDDQPQAAIHYIFDTLNYFAQIDTSTTESLMLLQIKRCSVAAFYSLLNNKQMAEIFVQKPYASIITNLFVLSHDVDSMNLMQLPELRLLNILHLEQYILSLDMCERMKGIKEAEHEIPGIWNHAKINRDPLILNAVSTTISKCNGWKPYVSKSEMQSFLKGRIGNDEFNIVSLPPNPHLPKLEECGNKHKFKGKINITNSNEDIYFPTFVVEDLQLSEGKWYYCVRLPLGGMITVGWATTGFNPNSSRGIGMGDDEYSWGYTGFSGRCLHNNESKYFRGEIRWNENDVCGCGIEIDGQSTTIKYWLNKEFLGIGFSHTSNKDIESAYQANMLPNGPRTHYFPSISVLVYGSATNTGVCEFIFSPEDMTDCPLPEGYKPLLLPKLINIKNVLVAYPYSAYLVGNNIQDYFHTIRCSQPNAISKRGSFLRDFANDHHLEVPFTIDQITEDHHLLKLSADSNGLPLSIDNHESLTISFDFEILTANLVENSQDELDITLFALGDDTFPIRITLYKLNDDFTDETIPHRKRIAILFQAQEQTKIYINNEYRTLGFCHTFDPAAKTTLNVNILPHIAAGIKNLGIWKYALSEELIRRLFIYGLSYVTADYQRLKEYRREANTFTFIQDQQYFISESLVPFNQPFEANSWEKKKKQTDHDESIYFKTIPRTHQSVVQLFGNKTYLVLDTSTDLWSQYTLVLDISIPNFPMKNHSSGSSNNEPQLTLVTLDTQSEIYITPDGHLCLSGGKKSVSTLKLNEYIRLVISVQRTCLKIHVNGSLELNVPITDDQFKVKFGRIDLFREVNLTKNTTAEDKLRIECKSITFLNKSISTSPSFVTQLIKSTECSLDKLVSPPFSIVLPSLMAIGYKEEWIKFVIKYYHTTNFHLIDTSIRKQHHMLLKAYHGEQRQHKIDILSRLTPYIDKTKSEDLVMLLKSDNDEQITAIDNIVAVKDDEDDMVLEKQWYHESIRGLEKAPENSHIFRRLGNSGREFVEGIFKRDERLLEFQGVRHDVSAEGLIGEDQYRLTVSEDRQSFEGVTCGNEQLWDNIIRGKTEEATRREIIEENIELYHRNINSQVIYSFVIVAINRFISIVYYRKHFFKSSKWIFLSITLQWIFGFLVPVPQIYQNHLVCRGANRGIFINSYTFITLVLCPLILMCSSNISVFMLAVRSRARINTNQNQIETMSRV